MRQQEGDSVQQRFVAQVTRDAERVALRMPGSDAWQLSYGELDRWSDALAQRLLVAGVVAGDAVGLYAGRSAAAVASLLAILKLGAAYVPLGPDFPRERIRFVLDDTGARVVLVQHDLLATAADWGVATLTLEPRPIEISAASALPVHAGSRDDRAYVLYTSGSTGRPKGVEVAQRGILRLVDPANTYCRFDADRRFLLLAPLTFDAATFEIWGALLNGGCCVIYPREGLPDPSELAALLRSERITTVWLTASLFNWLVDSEALAGVALDELLAGGEALSVAHVRRAQQQLPATRIINGYGPTETTTFACCYPVPRPVPADWVSIPIGPPIFQTRVYVVDDSGKPVPAGTEGELLIGGDGVALGYRNLPEQTAQRFRTLVVDGATQRVYATGDRVVLLDDAVVEYRGRSDDQVKISGYRIELGEINHALKTHAAVRDAFTVVQQADSGARHLVAFVAAPGAVTPALLREHLTKRLPHYMVPTRFVVVEQLPINANGKVDRNALIVLDVHPAAAPASRDDRDVRAALHTLWCDALGVTAVGDGASFYGSGGTSLLYMDMLTRAQQEFALPLRTLDIFEYPDFGSLCAALQARLQHGTPAADSRGKGATERDQRAAIAVIGMSARVPGARDVHGFWRNLLDGVDSMTHFTDAEIDPSIAADLRNDPDYVRARGVIPEADCFDAAFFGISAGEAALIDPQQRVFLEIAWSALEDAGVVPSSAVSIGVFAGTGANTYFLSNVLPAKGVDGGVGELARALASEKDYVATRTAFKLGLTGPAVSIHTACSTSLVAVAQAVDSLRAGRCDVAIAGGVSISTPLNAGYLYQQGSMLSPDGRCRPFDKDAAGTLFNSGAGAVVLKPLTQAQADGDRIYAVIRGVGLNNDGSDKASFTAPAIKGQVDVIRQAQRDAGVEASSISYVETHGTATPLGDPIEIEALTRAFRADGASDTGFCAVGSLKGNVGHLVAAAGVAGLIKTALAMHHRTLPPSLHFREPNPHIDFATSPFFVCSAKTAWRQSSQPLRAGVSSFGVGGTNAHVVLEQAPAMMPVDVASQPQLLLLSAKDDAALERSTAQLAEYLREPDAPLGDIAWTLQHGRSHFQRRRWAVADDPAAARAVLTTLPSTATRAGVLPDIDRGVVFMFPGQGSQYPAMGRGLYQRFAAYREAADTCFEQLRHLTGEDFAAVIFGAEGEDSAAAAERLRQTVYTQPALFVTEYAMARLWMSLGLRPTALIGHSIGEFVAATLAGVFELGDALSLVVERARLMQAQPSGAMYAVQRSADELRPQLPASCDIAAINGSTLCVVAGPHEAMAQLAEQWAGEGVGAKPLHTSHAFHSPMMEPVLPLFAEAVAKVKLCEPCLPILSTALADWLTPAQACSVDYWTTHLRKSVRFADGVKRLLSGAPSVYLEVGPGNTAATLAAQQMRGGTREPVISSLGPVTAIATGGDEQRAFLAAAGELWLQGQTPDWSALHASRGCMTSLPTYPFAREKHWLEPPLQTSLAMPSPMVASAVRVAAPSIFSANLPAASALIVTNPKDVQTLLIETLIGLMADSSGEDLQGATAQTSFLELGFDSLFLTQAALALKKRFKVDVPFRRLLSDLGDFGSLARHLEAEADPATLPTPTAAAAPLSPAPLSPALPSPSISVPVMPTAVLSASAGLDVQQVIAQQLQLMARQLEMLGAASIALPSIAAPVPVVVQAAPAPAAAPVSPLARADENKPAKPFGAQTRIDVSSRDEFSPEQRQHYQQLLDEYVARTARSKGFTEETRPRVADPRVVSGFRPAVKELTYPIVVERSKGCRLWDLDGNEYIDTLCGYGSMFFGYQPEWIVEALTGQLQLGMEIGPQHPLVAEVAAGLHEFTGHDRFAFCNTGSEAVLGAMRMARTATGRSKIVMFTGDYHGIVDEVIVRGGRNLKSFPAAAGIMPEAVSNMLVLDYGSEEALEIIREQADDIAGVLVETVQSRHPALVPVEFLQSLRALTEELDIALIFDEVITGFRIAPGGFQQYIGVQADIATYGKVIGGGLSLGLIGGKARFLDTLDGGAWRFGDDSKPEVGVTYFAGTFVRHPLALAAAKAVMDFLRQQGPELQAGVNERAARFARDLNLYFQRVGAPILIEQFCSMMYFKFTEDLPWGELLFADMRRQGIHIWYGRPMFVSCAHSEEDLHAVTQAFKRALARMQEWGFIPGSSRDERGRSLAPPDGRALLGLDEKGNPAWFVETAEAGVFAQKGDSLD